MLKRIDVSILSVLSCTFRRLRKPLSMTLCEYRFERFNACGDDKYVDRFARRLDELFLRGWTLVDSRREMASPGWWRVELFRDKISKLENASAGV